MTPERQIGDVDDLLVVLSSPPRFQTIQFIFLALQYLPLALNDFIVIFYGVSPAEVICVEENAHHGPAHSAANSSGLIWNFTHDAPDYICHCPGRREYVYEGKQWSTIADMDLVCDRASLVNLASVIYFVGQIIATPIFGWLADHYGRRPTLLLSNAFYAAATIGLVFSYDVISFMILRFLVGFFRQGMNGAFYVLMVEWIVPHRRDVLGATAELTYTFGVLIITLIAYLLGNWHYIQAALAVMTVFSIPLIWFAPESLIWLCSKNRVKEAQENCQKVAKFNGIQLSSRTMTDIAEIAKRICASQPAQHYSFIDCFRTPYVRKTTILCCFIWLACYLGFLGVTYLSSEIAEDIYMNLAIHGALEFVPIILAVLVAHKCGNRKPLIAYYVLAAILSIAAGATPAYEDSIPALKIVQNVFAFLSRIAFVGTACVIFVYTSQLFPTVIRNNGFSICCIALRVGSMVTPLLPLLGKHTGYPGSGFLVLGGVAVLAAIAAFFLRETQGVPLPETIAEVEGYIEKKKPFDRSLSTPGSPVPSTISGDMVHPYSSMRKNTADIEFTGTHLNLGYRHEEKEKLEEKL